MILKNSSITIKFISITSLMALTLVAVLTIVNITTAGRTLSQQAEAFIASLRNEQEKEKQLLEQALMQKGEVLKLLLAQTAAGLISAYDFDTLAQLAKSSASDQDVVFVTFYDAEKKPITEEGRRLEGIEVKTSEIKFEDELLGYVKIGLSLESIRQNMAELTNRIDAVVQQTGQTRDEARRISIINAGVSAVVGLVLLCLAVYFTLNRLIVKPVNRIVEQLTSGAGRVAAASNQISSSSQSLAEGSSQQAASIEETSASLEEMSSMTKQNAEHANQADNLMKEATEVVSQANNSMADLTTSMEEITKAGEETAKIIKTIDEIAFQTNLLALNAAVEAARAGEAGAGFAVVADEVRNLAMRAADAAKNTTTLIDDTTQKVKAGSNYLVTTNDSFKMVTESAARVSELVAEIAAASTEQAQGIEHASTAVAQMDKVTQQNAANAEESASAAEEMNTEAVQMNSIVDHLVELVEGSLKKNAGGVSQPIIAEVNKPDLARPSAPDKHRPSVSNPAAAHAELIPLGDADLDEF